MPILYKCKDCSYETYHKGSFYKHLNRKRVCYVVVQEMNKSDIKVEKKFGLFNLEHLEL